MDYIVATSLDIPDIEITHLETPSPLNPLGVKGVGESGVIPPAAVIASAIEDAFGPEGREILETRLSPEPVWRLKLAPIRS